MQGTAWQHLPWILPSLTQEMFLPHCLPTPIPHIPSSVTGMLTAQSKPALILWIIFLCQLFKKGKGVRRGEDCCSGSPWRRVKNQKHKETVSAILGDRLVWKVLQAQAHINVQMLNKPMPCLVDVLVSQPYTGRVWIELLLRAVSVVLLPWGCLEPAHRGLLVLQRWAREWVAYF